MRTVLVFNFVLLCAKTLKLFVFCQPTKEKQSYNEHFERPVRLEKCHMDTVYSLFWCSNLWNYQLSRLFPLIVINRLFSSALESQLVSGCLKTAIYSGEGSTEAPTILFLPTPRLWQKVKLAVHPRTWDEGIRSVCSCRTHRWHSSSAGLRWRDHTSTQRNNFPVNTYFSSELHQQALFILGGGTKELPVLSELSTGLYSERQQQLLSVWGICTTLSPSQYT